MHNKTLHGRWMTQEFETDLVSVIVPTYNRAYCIEQTLDSVRKQTYRPIEIIVVDDGSSDNTEDVLTQWIKKHDDGQQLTCRYFFQTNSGVCAARNLALIHCKGEFIQFLDSDDIIHANRFEKVIGLFKSSSCDYVETGFEGFCSDCGEAYEKHYGHVDRDQIELLVRGSLWPNTLRPTYRRSLVYRTGPWNEEMTTFQDYEYVIRALLPDTHCCAVRDILAGARRGGKGRMSDIFLTKEGRELRIYCECLLRDRIIDNHKISMDAKRFFAMRIYGLGIRSNAAGWTDLGSRCYAVADSMRVELDGRGKLKRLICRMGRCGGIVHEMLYRFKNIVFGLDRAATLRHECCKKPVDSQSSD